MTGKLAARNHGNVDWEAIERACEIPRTYQIETIGGGLIFKMYKPSEMKQIMSDINNKRTKRWVDVKIVGRKRNERP